MTILENPGENFMQKSQWIDFGCHAQTSASAELKL